MTDEQIKMVIQRIDRINERFDRLDAKFDSINANKNYNGTSIDTRFDSLESTMSETIQNFKAIYDRQGKINNKIDTMSSELEQLHFDLAEFNEESRKRRARIMEILNRKDDYGDI